MLRRLAGESFRPRGWATPIELGTVGAPAGCTEGRSRLFPGRTYLAEAGEPLPTGARRLRFSDAQYQLPGYLSRSELIYTPRAAALLAGYPSGASIATLLNLLQGGRLELHELTLDRALRGGTMQREAPPTEPPTPPEAPVETAWIEVELLTEERRPVAGEHYRIILPDGTPREGRLNEQGKVRLEGFEPGTCHVSFPRLRRTHADP